MAQKKKKGKNVKKRSKKPSIRKRLADIENELEEIKEVEEKLLKEGAEEEEDIEDIKKMEIEEEKRLVDIEKLAGLMSGRLSKEEKQLDKMGKVILYSMDKVTRKDVLQAVIGAVFGISIQFAFVDALIFAEGISIWNVTAILIFNIIIGFLLIYFSGIRKVRLRLAYGFLPTRLVSVYGISLIMTFVFLTIFGAIQLGVTPLDLIYRYVVVISLAALIGAASIDLIS